LNGRIAVITEAGGRSRSWEKEAPPLADVAFDLGNPYGG
jgi:hypothetical protein